MRYTLKTSLLKGTTRKHFIHSDKWISNGRFAVLREHVKDCYKFIDSNNESAKYDVERVLDFEAPITFYKTINLVQHEGQEYLRLFKSDCGKEVYFDEMYIKLFSIYEMEGKDENSPFTDMKVLEDRTLVLMPVKLKEKLAA